VKFIASFGYFYLAGHFIVFDYVVAIVVLYLSCKALELIVSMLALLEKILPEMHEQLIQIKSNHTVIHYCICVELY
jgi:hypothetical protein